MGVIDVFVSYGISSMQFAQLLINTYKRLGQNKQRKNHSIRIAWAYWIINLIWFSMYLLLVLLFSLVFVLIVTTSTHTVLLWAQIQQNSLNYTLHTSIKTINCYLCDSLQYNARMQEANNILAPNSMTFLFFAKHIKIDRFIPCGSSCSTWNSNDNHCARLVVLSQQHGVYEEKREEVDSESESEIWQFRIAS